jgi:ElaB/YqjD/DUF883 family membrane-anchored ribosome-binding protein
MNNRQSERKIAKDVGKIKKDVSTLAGDSVAHIGRYGDDVGQAAGKARRDLTSWAEAGVSRVGDGIDKLMGDASETAGRVSTMVKKDIGHGIEQYNTKAKELVDKVPGGIVDKVAKYPWVAISIGLVFGLLVGGLFSPVRRLHG